MGNVQLKLLGDEHFQESMKLAQFAFQYTRTEEQLEEARVRIAEEPSERWGVFVDGQLAAMATVLSLTTYIGGRSFAMGGVAGVATWPEHRRQGYVGKLLVHLLERMRGNGQNVSFLHPFAFGFYRKYGWETYTELKTYTIQVKQLPPRVPYNGRFERQDSYEAIHDVYETYASRYNGSLSRSALWWKHRIPVRKPGQIALYRDGAGEAQGYLLYEVKESSLTVHELIYLTGETYEAIWSFIAQHDSMIEKAVWNAPIDDRLPDRLPDPRIKQEVVPYFMARIVDVEAFLRDYPFLAAEQEDRVYLEVADEHAPWNNGCFELVITPAGQAKVSRLTDVPEIGEALKLGIGALSSLLLGYRKVSDFIFMNRMQGASDTINRLQNRIPGRTAYLPDFF
ncbi:GNAT family N-acetyltransferase [Paenibacillus soyae]|uniref:GNAT family N-acetyltransferase n=1 Tax=Paenibacillus soyae TaxID=2969249 RepID=A0A9X2SE63_9BACL|nr:GNAT family N-acetyltransferase [Paenibacillus soyae]MCR2807877.1 GNAT family N-acetyltransferase [Paenibacillus soyae]